MLTDPNKKVPADLEFCNCKDPEMYKHTNGKLYCAKCEFKIKEEMQ